MMALRQAILNWDGKSSDYLAGVYQKLACQADAITQLVKLMAEPACQPGASWLLKQHLAHLQELTPVQQNRLLDIFVALDCWQTQLHLLQCFAAFIVDASRKTAVEAKLRWGLSHSNKFVRAWSFHGLFYLAKQYPDMQDEVTQLLETALVDEPASVKARVRSLLKLGF